MEHMKGALKSVFSKHTIIHGTLMLGMAFAMVAAMPAVALSSPAFGDIGLAAVDMSAQMITGLFDGVSVIGDAVANAQNGVWSPQVYEIGAHTQHASAVAAVEPVSHAAHASAEALTTTAQHTSAHVGDAAVGACESVAGITDGFQEWSANLEASGELSEIIADADQGGPALLDLYQEHCHEH